MSNAAAAYYAYLAQVDNDKAATLRRFGYNASADYVEDRARRHAARAIRESKEAAPYDEAASRFPSTDDSHDALHTTSVSDNET